MVLLAAVLATLAAGCGGSSSHTYSLDKTSACLKTKPVRLGGPLDFVASTATGGAVKIHTGSNFLTLVFGKTVDDANNIADAYRRFAARNVGINDVLVQDQNAVMLWHNHWSQPDLDLITGCLK
jgi:hypothetical protein